MTTGLTIAAMLAAISLAAPPASAQLGKLKKIGADAAKDAKDAVNGKKPDGADAGGGARVDYTITEERATAVIAALQGVADAARKEQALADAKTAYDAKVKTFTTCAEKVATSGVMPDGAAMTSPKAQAMMTTMAQVNERAVRAQQANNYRSLVALQDSALVLQMLTSQMMFKSSCTGMPYKPAILNDNEAAHMQAQMAGTDLPSVRSDLVVAPDKRAGMTTGQFGRIREAIAIWTLQKTGQLPATAYKFTEAEQAVLNGKAAQLAPLAPFFKSGTMTWISWGDIKAW
jgi:hypothetical protein